MAKNIYSSTISVGKVLVKSSNHKILNLYKLTYFCTLAYNLSLLNDIKKQLIWIWSILICTSLCMFMLNFNMIVQILIIEIFFFSRLSLEYFVKIWYWSFYLTIYNLNIISNTNEIYIYTCSIEIAYLLWFQYGISAF